MKRIKVLIADDHPVVREGLRAMLATDEAIEVVGEAGDGADAVARMVELEPDIVLMDLRMPNLDGIEATRRIKAQNPAMAVIMLTMYDNDAYVIDAVRAGAGGYLLKDTSRDLLIHTIRAVNCGGTLIKTALLREAIGGLVNSAAQRSNKGNSQAIGSVEELTPREREVLDLLAEGCTNNEISQKLIIAEDTAKKHVQSIIAKLGASDRTHAVMKAARAGLVK
jgi:DNA-binding NarL/FixJ family response regulator